jgi:hypothetical protein
MAITREIKLPTPTQLPTTVLNADGFDINGGPVTVKVSVAATDFTAAAATEDIEIFSLPPRGHIIKATIKHTTAFSGGTLSAANLSVGITGSLDAILGDFNVFQAVSDTVSSSATTAGVFNFGVATSIRCEAEATGDTWDNVSTGAADIWLTFMILPA